MKPTKCLSVKEGPFSDTFDDRCNNQLTEAYTACEKSLWQRPDAQPEYRIAQLPAVCKAVRADVRNAVQQCDHFQ
jgi:hypothetical protein